MSISCRSLLTPVLSLFLSSLVWFFPAYHQPVLRIVQVPLSYFTKEYNNWKGLLWLLLLLLLSRKVSNKNTMMKIFLILK